MLIVVILLLLFATYIYIFLQQPKFGSLPKGSSLEKIKTSPNYKKGQFQNISPTPMLTEGTSYTKMFYEFFFADKKHNKPSAPIPSLKSDLKNLNPAENIFVWFGHSSYFMQIDQKKILVDPVFSGAASPVAFTTRAFAGTDRYTADDIPEIDFLFISHDHWDHIDYTTLIQLKPKIKKIICGLGVAAHFERWGFDRNIIIEKDWNETADLCDGFIVNTIPARHFSGRGFKRNQSLWMSYALKTPTMNIFIGGDSGYDKHFAEAGNKFGPFDLAILENGQYDQKWKYIHMLPEEVLIAAKDLKAKRIVSVHNSKFALANHEWDHPMKTLMEFNLTYQLKVMTPRIGEPVDLNNEHLPFSNWWQE